MKRRPALVPAIALDRASEAPLHRQISLQIAAEIREGGIPDGARLPSSRTLAHLLGVSRNTVLQALDQLAADDLIRGQHGSGVRVRAGKPVPDMSWFGLRQVIRDAGYPARVVTLADSDGNAIYLRY